MSGNNLKILNTGLDHRYINGIPIVEAEIDIQEVYNKVARLSALAVQGDPYYSDKSKTQKVFSELHGEGDRITRDFIEEGARDLLPIFTPLQRLIPEGTYDTTPVEYKFTGVTDNFTWTNPDPSHVFIDNIKIIATKGSSGVKFVVNGAQLGAISLPDAVSGSYLAYDLAAYLGGAAQVYSYTANQNASNSNMVSNISLLFEPDKSADFTCDIIITGAKYDAIGWIKALTETGDVRLPATRDDIRIAYLYDTFRWDNDNNVKVTNVAVKHNVGGGYVTIKNGDVTVAASYITDNTVGGNVTGDAGSITVEVDSPTDDFNYDLIISTEMPNVLPSPRFEFDSGWNEGKIIYRYQNMDNRVDKLNYTSETLRSTRVDPNIFDEVLKYLKDSLKNYVLKELYEATGNERKAAEYRRKYEHSRGQAKFWVRSEKGLQTQLDYAG